LTSEFLILACVCSDNFNYDPINDGEFTIVPTTTTTNDTKQNQLEEQELLTAETQVMIDSLDETEAPLLLLNDDANKQVESSSSSPSVSSLSSNNSEANSRDISPLHDRFVCSLFRVFSLINFDLTSFFINYSYRFQDGGDAVNDESKQDEKKIDVTEI
jgi:hypothetical protein